MKVTTFKFSLALLSFAITITLFYATHLFNSNPDSWHDQIITQVNKGGTKAFWYNLEEKTLKIVNLEKNQPPEIVTNLQLKPLKWSLDGEKIYCENLGNTPPTLSSIDLNQNQLHTTEEVSTLNQINPQEFFITAQKDGAVKLKSYSVKSQESKLQFRLFAQHKIDIGGVSSSQLNHNHTLLAVGIRNYNEPDGLEVWNLATQSCILKSDQEASHIFFSPDNSILYTVRDTAAITQLHSYNLKTGQHLKSSEQLGPGAVAAISPDYKSIAISLYNKTNGSYNIDLFSTNSLTKTSSHSTAIFYN